MSPSCFGEPGLNGAPTIFADLVLEPRPCAGQTRPSCATGCCGRSRSRAAPCAPEPRRADARAARRRVVIRSATRRGCKTRQRRKAMSAFSAPYSHAFSIGARAKPDEIAARARDFAQAGWACGRESVRRAYRCCGRRRSRPRRACRRAAWRRRSARRERRACASTCMSNLMSWPILRTPGDSSSGFRSAIASASGDLVRREAAAVEEIVGAGRGGRSGCSRPLPA